MSAITHTATEHDFVRKVSRTCGPGCELVESECECGLQKRERILEGEVRGIEFRFTDGWQWLNPVQFLRVELPVMLCPHCRGAGCDTCRGLGVLKRVAPHPAGSTVSGLR